MKKFKSAMTFVLAIVFLLSSCAPASAVQVPGYATEKDKARWKSDALAYIDEMIRQSDSEPDIVNKSGFGIVVRDIKTLKRIETYINHSTGIRDVTNVDFAPSSGHSYRTGRMPVSNYDHFLYEYENPYQLISFGFTQSDENEFQDYLTRVIAESNLSQFNDVSPTDWFCYDVAYAYTYCRMEGNRQIGRRLQAREQRW
jgi:hypothetical protein